VSRRPSSGGGECDELACESDRIVVAPALDPAAVVVRDERLQHVTVVIRRDGCKTAPADGRNARPLGVHPAPCLGIVYGNDDLRLPFPDLERERPLARLRKHFRRLETVADLGPEPETVETAGREDDRVEASLGALAEARIDVPA
jgi:hypothetical protein